MNQKSACLRLYGGLGNQLFQICALAYLSKKYHLKPYVNIQTGSYKVKRLATSLEVVTYINSRYIKETVKVPTAIKTLSTLRVGRLFGANDKSMHKLLLSDSVPQGLECNCFFIDGYFQAFWDFNLLEIALSCIDFNPLYDYRRKNADQKLTNLACIHIRGRDFLDSSNNMNLCDEQYYLESIRNLHYESSFEKYLIVTDDQQYGHNLCDLFARTFPSLRFSVSPPKLAIQDFSLLVSSPAKIVSNSTFGFWAMALSSPTSIKFSPGCIASGINRLFTFANERVVFTI